MHDVGIGDRQDDARSVLPEPVVEKVLEVDHVGRPVGPVLVVHAMVGGSQDDGPLPVERSQIAVDHGIKVVGERRARAGLVLNIVRGGKIHEVGALCRHQPDARRKHELRQSPPSKRPAAVADEAHGVLDAIELPGRLVGPLGGKGNGTAARHTEARATTIRAAYPWRSPSATLAPAS